MATSLIWASAVWLIDNCLNKLSADQYHVTILRAQIARVFFFFFFSLIIDANQGLVFRLEKLKPGDYFRGKGGNTCKGKISTYPCTALSTVFFFFFFLI